MAFLEEKTSYKEDELLKKDVYWFLNRLRYYAHQGNVQKEYARIMNPVKTKRK